MARYGKRDKRVALYLRVSTGERDGCSSDVRWWWRDAATERDHDQGWQHGRHEWLYGDATDASRR